MKFNVVSDKVEKYESKGKSYATRKLTVIGAERDLAEQLCEINLPVDHPEVGAGKRIEFLVREIPMIFSGKPRLRGDLVADVPAEGGRK